MSIVKVIHIQRFHFSFSDSLGFSKLPSYFFISLFIYLHSYLTFVGGLTAAGQLNSPKREMISGLSTNEMMQHIVLVVDKTIQNEKKKKKKKKKTD